MAAWSRLRPSSPDGSRTSVASRGNAIGTRLPGGADAALERELDGQGRRRELALSGNWSGNAVPTPSDDVTIELGGNPTIQISSGTQAVRSLTSTDSILISGGSLSVAADSTMSGGLTMTGGSLVADGSSITFSVTGSATVSGGSLEAEGGATLSLSQLTTYAGAVGSTVALEATGAGSLLSLPKLATVTEDTSNYSSRTQIQALSGGDVELPALTAISGGAVQLESDGAGSTLNINVLASLTGNAGQQFLSGLQVTNHGTASASALATLKEANLSLDGTGTLATSQITTFSGGTMALSAGTASFAGLNDADGSSFEASGGGIIGLPDLSSYAAPAGTTAMWTATGSGSKLSLSKLGTITEDTGSYSSRTQIQALSGGDVELPALTRDQWRARAARERRRRQHAQYQCARQSDGQRRAAVFLRPSGHESRDR